MVGDSEKSGNCSHSVIENHHAEIGIGTWRKRVVLAIAFAVLFHLVDSATAFAQKSAAAPAFYLPVGLAIALVLWGGPKYWPLVLFWELLGAPFNYHRALFSWCGIPGVIGVYIFYAAGLSVVRRWWPVDVALGTVTDVGRITFIFLSSAAPTAVVGALTLLGDGISVRPAFTKTAINWWESDAISILTFTPMLLLCVVPAVDMWMNHTAGGKVQPRTGSHLWPTAHETSELAAQATAIAAAL